MLPWMICLILIFALGMLVIKIRVMQKSMDEIRLCVLEHLSADTNQLICVSSGDKYVKALANEISKQLSLLRVQKQKYFDGDRELKEAITNISHDLRTPLTAICGYLELLEREEKSESVSRYIRNISNRTEALKALTEELFRYSLISSVSEMNYERVNVTSALEESLISFYADFRKKNINPEISLPEKEVWCVLDKSALMRIFSNVISNAVKYSGGDFSVRMDENGNVVFSNLANGLSAVDVAKLFDRFYTVDSARKSTGLGLSIAKILCERMNGNISADYNDGILYINVSFCEKI